MSEEKTEEQKDGCDATSGCCESGEPGAGDDSGSCCCGSGQPGGMLRVVVFVIVLLVTCALVAVALVKRGGPEESADPEDGAKAMPACCPADAETECVVPDAGVE